MSLDQQMRWAENWALILELWPDWAPTDAQTELWRKRLQDCAQVRLKEAIESVATNLIGRNPRLSGILKAYKEAQRSERLATYGALPVQDSCVEQDLLDMRREVAEMAPAERLANLKGAAPLLVVPLVDGLGPDSAGLRIGASDKIIDQYQDAPVDDWPRMLVGFTWANAQEDIPF